MFASLHPVQAIQLHHLQITGHFPSLQLELAGTDPKLLQKAY